jgi:hypothetical protein
MANNKKYMTKPLLREINEHSGGGFVLFYFNEDGLPEVSNNFETSAEALALQYYVQNWSKALEKINIETMTNAIVEDSGMYEDDEENGPEEI